MPEPDIFPDFLTQDPATLALLHHAQKFAQLDAPLLIEGETGTGKDLLAVQVLALSPRSQEKFIAINCAGLPNDKAESEMFGEVNVENNQTTLGFFEYANGGTVLLDGVSELPLSLQAKLLRFLTDGSFKRVGEDESRHADVRLICTSQIDLKEAVIQGKMRQDLYHRLTVLTLKIPPLRERSGDIPLLAQHFVNQISHQLKRTFAPLSEAFLAKLNHYHWSGNVRELYNLLYRLCTLNDGGELNAEELNLPKSIEQALPIFQQNLSLEEMMNDYEEKLLRHFYQQYPTTRKLAERLGVSHTAIANKLKHYGIQKPTKSPQ